MNDLNLEQKRPWLMSLEELVAASEGRIRAQFERVFSGVGTDTRADLSGKIFVALKGENFDAHDFLPKAVENGASALLIHRLPEEARDLLNQVTVIEVDDTLISFQMLAGFWRHKMRAKILALTGSNGKTTTKEFAATLIGSRLKVHSSKGSFNNHWGVPMSLLGIESDDQVAIIEMGMNHIGELKELSLIAEPDVVLVTMVGRGHLEGLGSIENVAKAKAEIYESASPRATFCFNLENTYTRQMYERFAPNLPKEQVLTFATAAELAGGINIDVSLQVVEGFQDEKSMRIGGIIRGVRGEATVPVFGAHNITNLMAAAVLALAAGLSAEDIWSAFPLCETVWGRNQWVNLASGAKVLFDGYNANPESMLAALKNFAQLPHRGRKFAVLGEMKEMGEQTKALHRELGEQVAKSGFDEVCFFGVSGVEFAAGLKAGGFSKNPYISTSYEQSLALRMLPVLEVGDLVLMKGSRGMHLEKALLDLKPIDFQGKK